MTGARRDELPYRAPRATGPSWLSGTAPGTAPEQPSGADDDTGDFWLPIEEVHWDGRPVERPARRFPWRRADRSGVPRRRPVRRSRRARHPAAGLAGLVASALLASFFGWVSAEPFWLAAGHGIRGTVTVTKCTGGGLVLRCRGEFQATGGSVTVPEVRLIGLGPDQRETGTRARAVMVDAGSGSAYAAPRGVLHLYWVLGLVLILLCGMGIVWVTGALRLPDRRARRNATCCAMATPLLLAAGFLVAAF